MRQVLTPPDTGLKDLSDYVPDFVDALTGPLTAEEQESGTYQAPIPPRIAMTGTYDEILEYFEGDQFSPSPLAGGGWCWMTDGSPIVPPTEERVARMLTGTSHSPDEELNFGGRIAEDRIANVEKVAINAVMAGCEPEYLPVVLAVAETGACTGYTGDAVYSHLYVVSGPIAQEIGMNYGFSFLTPGNKPNTTIQRACVLMGINLAGLKVSVNNGERMGNTMYGQIFSEAPLTPWPTLNVQKGYQPTESILLNFSSFNIVSPGVSPHGTDAPGLKGFQLGSPGQIVEAFEHYTPGSIIFTPDAAQLYIDEFGYETPGELKQYVYDNALCSLEWAQRQYYPAGRRPVFPEPDANGMIRKLFQEGTPDAIEIIVAGGPGPAWGTAGTLGMFGGGIILIDKWR